MWIKKCVFVEWNVFIKVNILFNFWIGEFNNVGGNEVCF